MLTCHELGWACQIKVLPWRRALQLAEDGLVDGIFTVIDSPERQSAFYITPMLAKSRYNFYTRRDNDFIYTKPEDLNGYRVGVYGPSGTSYMLEQLLKKTENTDIRLITNNQRLLLMLSAGRFGSKGVVVLNNDVARHLIEHDQLYALRNAGHMSSTAYGIGFSRKRVRQHDFNLFNEQLENLRKNGKILRILRQYGLEVAE